MRLGRNLMVMLSTAFVMNASAAITPVYQITDNSGVYLQTTFTHDIYQYSAEADLNDVVVTDAKGNKLPYRIITPTPEVVEKAELIPTHFFPVAVGAAPETLLALSSASIHIDDNAISVSVEKGAKDLATDTNTPIDFYVVDLSELKTHVDGLQVEWQGNDTNNYLEVQVSGSNDLQNWQYLTKSTLVKLQKEGKSLIRNKIPLHLMEGDYAYVQLKFLRGNNDLSLTQVSVHNNEKQHAPQEMDTWHLNGTLASNQTSAWRTSGTINGDLVAAWNFTRTDITPITNLSLDLANNSYGDFIKIYSRDDKTKAWQLLYHGIWFNAQVGDEWQHSDPIALNTNSDMYWRIELNELVRTTFTPKLGFHRQSQLLQFIANNTPPYNIAVDDKVTSNIRYTSEAIFTQLINGKNIVWQDVGHVALNPDMNSFSRQLTKVNVKSLLFWGIMVLALGILVVMVLRLMRQMKHTEPKV